MFFIAAKLFWLLAAPLNLACLLALAAIAFRVLRWRRMAGAALWTGAVVLLLAAATPAGPYAALALETRFPPRPELPAEIGGIIVLGGSLDTDRSVAWNMPIISDDPDRLTALISLAHRYPEAPIIFAGGYGGLGSVEKTEAPFVAELLTAMGFDTSRIRFDPNSRNTRENEIEARKLAGAEYGQKPWVLVTGALHMPRAVGIFRLGGWTVLPWPVDPATFGPDSPWQPLNFGQTLVQSTRALREWIGLTAYYAAGYTATLLPE